MRKSCKNTKNLVAIQIVSDQMQYILYKVSDQRALTQMVLDRPLKGVCWYTLWAFCCAFVHHHITRDHSLSTSRSADLFANQTDTQNTYHIRFELLSIVFTGLWWLSCSLHSPSNISGFLTLTLWFLRSWARLLTSLISSFRLSFAALAALLFLFLWFFL